MEIQSVVLALGEALEAIAIVSVAIGAIGAIRTALNYCLAREKREERQIGVRSWAATNSAKSRFVTGYRSIQNSSTATRERLRRPDIDLGCHVHLAAA